MYKMITIDVDDTLLNDDRLVSAATSEAIAAAILHGVSITLATGRMFASAKNVAGQLNLNVPIITYQGSLIKTLLDEKVLYERFVPPSASAKIYKFVVEHGLQLQLYHDDKLYSQMDNPRLQHYVSMSNVPYYIEKDFTRLLSLPLIKLLIIDDPAYLDRIIPELQRLVGDEVHITKSKPYFLEFLHKEGTKGHAVKFLADHYGYDLSEVIAIGDAWNDHEMLETAGLGVAMGNAIEELKRIADYVTLTNNEDGVKHVIDRFIFGKVD